MGIKEDFEIFIKNLDFDSIEEIKNSVKRITKKLNNRYYGLEDDSKHMYIVGSIGRETAIKGVSDVDILFDFPYDIYKKFDKYRTNGQTAFLQDVKNVLKEKYPNTNISGDGQVIVINFKKYTIELVPGFKVDNRFKYPDTHNGGSWKYTDPLSEIKESKRIIRNTNKNFKYISNMLRSWKNNQGFKFSGLLIDTLTYKFLDENTIYKNIGFDEYLNMSKSLFKYLKDLNKDQEYWYALGSNQKVYNTDNGRFIKKAKKAYNKIINLTEESADLNKNLRDIFGVKFPKKNYEEKKNIYYLDEIKTYNNTEEFIENLFPIDIKYNLTIDCDVIQNGFRTISLKDILKNKKYLSKKKRLEFYITSDFNFDKKSFNIYWKVKNEGQVAKEKNCIRGQIVKTDKAKHTESTSFIGEHFVECYMVENGVCVAKANIDVPISNYEYIMG